MLSNSDSSELTEFDRKSTPHTSLFSGACCGPGLLRGQCVAPRVPAAPRVPPPPLLPLPPRRIWVAREWVSLNNVIAAPVARGPVIYSSPPAIQGSPRAIWDYPAQRNPAGARDWARA
ncbi:hypothetical protein BDV28DRAFT_153163 [Aspergillus coremiiformis]|uniref:Uncharacterized protein n=1 Tax=Aspergillus coremiiformis TaxID=138285 RepID=A0A5N6YWW1_9EURO|nr:hypothetical protein BDV28DRAFT_153163 [Aspergillus coremiiformis]